VSADERKLPPLVREALSDPEADARELADAREALSHTSAALDALTSNPPPKLLERLLARTSSMPDKYAPFFDQLSELFDLDEAELRRELERAGDSEQWRFSGLPGARLFPVTAGPRARSGEAVLVRFAPGMSFPRHRHRGSERTLILAGGYADEAGREFHPGDIDKRDSDGAHSFRTFSSEPCIAAAVHSGFDFFAWPLRLLAKLTGR
jgi:predicted ChrR family anti-sigma factor